jgi:hypothetical protein
LRSLPTVVAVAFTHLNLCAWYKKFQWLPLEKSIGQTL